MLTYGAVYIVTFSLLLASALPVGSRLRVGMIMFLASNMMLAVTLMYPSSFALESSELLLYYIAVLTITSDPDALPA